MMPLMPSYFPLVRRLAGAVSANGVTDQSWADQSSCTVTIVLVSAVTPRLTDPYPPRSLVIWTTTPVGWGRNHNCVPVDAFSGNAVTSKPEPSFSHATRKTCGHVWVVKFFS